LPNWRDILNEVNAIGSAYDVVRRAYLGRLSERTGRNVITYYSGWLQKPQVPGGAVFSINDADKNGFMTCVHKLDRTKGLDLVLHTPGGDMAATESLVDYLRSMFGTDIRAIVPQIAMSGGTMIACACKEIVMGKESSIGPIDPQIGGIPAHGIIEEFNEAAREIKRDPGLIPLWQAIIAKYPPALKGECEKIIKWADQMVKEWLVSGMLGGQERADAAADSIVKGLGSHSLTLSHSRHISLAAARALGLRVSALEDDNGFQDAVLSLHHISIQTLSATPAVKLIENQNGVSYINQAMPA